MPDPPVPAVVWVTTADVANALGAAPSTPADVEWLASSTEAAQVVAWRRRYAAGYVDDPLTVPDPGVAAGCVAYAVARYRSRGAVDGYASYDEAGGFVPTGGTWAECLKLWGVPRMAFG